MLLDLHEKRQQFHVSVNHFFVTLGALVITLYLVFLQMSWRRAIVQSAAIVLIMAVFFAFARSTTGRHGAGRVRERIAFLKTQGLIAGLSVAAIVFAGLESGLTGLLTAFLLELRQYDQVSSKLGLILFLAGIAAGRALLGLISGKRRILDMIILLIAGSAVFSAVLFFVRMPPAAVSVVLFILGVTISVLLPLLITLTGFLYADMSGTAIGLVKLGIPIGGVLIPIALSMVSRYSSFRLSLLVFPMLSLAGCALLVGSRKMIWARLDDRTPGRHPVHVFPRA
jgi:predicted MFS family arabinose efflux permease